MEGLTRRTYLSMAGLPALAGLGAYAAREQGLGEGDGRTRFQPAGPGTARARIQERHLPNIPLVAHDGRSVRFYDDLVKDKKVVLTFISSAVPAESRRVTDNLATLQRFFGKRVGSDIFLYSIARTPERDTPSAMRNWAAQSGAGRGWRFLTGKSSDVEKLRHSLGFASANPTEDADPAYSIGLLRHGVEREMRWAHCQSQGSPRVIAHSIVLDFGPAPADPNAPISWTVQGGADPTSFVLNCERILAALD